LIISYEHRFVHIHNRKCAGSSVNALLCRHLGPDDIMLDSWEDARSAGCSYNRRFYRDFASEDGLRAIRKLARNTLKTRRRPSRTQIHEAYKAIYRTRWKTRIAFPDAAVVKDQMGSDWDRFYKFCVVRNSYAKAVSDYRWRTRNLGGAVTFNEFLRRAADPSRPDPEGVVPSPVTNWELYTINDEVVADRIVRFEHLSEDLGEVLQSIGLPSATALPHAKKTSGSSHRDWYTDDERRLVERLYGPEIERFGFCF
jgi:hypothetical protein